MGCSLKVGVRKMNKAHMEEAVGFVWAHADRLPSTSPPSVIDPITVTGPVQPRTRTPSHPIPNATFQCPICNRVRQSRMETG
jgi:hypothetical protein